MNEPVFSVWEGVFESFKEAGGDLDAFASEIWINKQKEKIYSHLNNLNLVDSKDYPLPIVVSMLLTQKDKISILDFGGGMGCQYLELLYKVSRSNKKVKYFIVDGKEILENIPYELQQYDNLKFFNSLDEIEEKVDIVHIGSTLQYVEDWKDLLQTLVINYSPKYFVFSDLVAGDVPTFVSHQIFYEKKIPSMFLNWTEFQDYLLSGLGYLLYFKSKFTSNILNQDKIYPNFSLPITHRIDRSLNAIFCR